MTAYLLWGFFVWLLGAGRDLRDGGVVLYTAIIMALVQNNNNIYGRVLFSYDDYIYQHSILVGRLWDEEVVDTILQHVKPGTDVLDIGANIGLVTLGVLQQAAARGIPRPAIHCFECNINTFNMLTYNTTGCPSVSLYSFALGDKTQLCNVTQLPQNMGCSYIYQARDEHGQESYDYSSMIPTDIHVQTGNSFVVCLPLDSILYQFTRPISVVKIDVEGFERQVLRGARSLLMAHRPVVIVEIWKIHETEVIAFFESIQYSRWERLKNPHYNNEDYVFYPDALGGSLSSLGGL
jgi:FkbM family methyltransferase